MISSAFDVVKFLNTEGATLASLQRHLATSAKQLYSSNIKLGLNFPSSEQSEDEKILIYDTLTDLYSIQLKADFTDINSEKMRIVAFPEHLALFNRVPIAIISVECGLDADKAAEIDIFIRIAISSAIDRINREIRQEIIVSKVNSNDLGSFLHRLIVEQGIQSRLSCRHISVFVRDWIGQNIKLKGTSSRIRSQRRPTDIRLHVSDTGKRVVRCHMSGEPVFEFDETRNLPMNGDSHEVDDQGAWSRIYWPIRLSKSTEPKLRRAPDRNNDGIARVTNCIGMDGEPLPFTWMHILVLDFFCEALYIIVDAFSAADEASFKKDEAFHNSMSVVDTITKNIESISDTIYNRSRERNAYRPPRFRLVALKGNTHISEDRVFQLLRTAYASAKDIGFQIARANDDVPSAERWEKTEFLIRDVILRAIDLVPDMCVAHSATRGCVLPTITGMISERGVMPPSVRGAPEALVSVFANLFENCVKYRKPGEKVEIEVHVRTELNHVLVVVRDHGVGIRADEAERIFNRGYRGPNAHEFAPRGSGLGLSWCEKVLRNFGGTISATPWQGGLEISVRLAKAR